MNFQDRLSALGRQSLRSSWLTDLKGCPSPSEDLCAGAPSRGSLRAWGHTPANGGPTTSFIRSISVVSSPMYRIIRRSHDQKCGDATASNGK